MHKRRLGWREMLPIVTRELRAASQRKFTYRLRFIVALIGGGQLLLAATFLSGFSVQFGRTLFWTSSLLGVLLAAGSGLILTVDSISREKRDGTLGLLFLTRLTGADVVLGKFVVGILSGFSVAFAALPFLAFSLCMGGVTALEFWVMSFLLLFLLAYSLTVGVFISALFRKESTVSLLFLAALFLPAAAVPLIILKWGFVPLAFAWWNPFYPALTLMDPWELYFPREYVLPALVFQFLLMLLMLAISCVILPWHVRSRPIAVPAPSLPIAKKLKRASRRAVLEINPALWLNERQNHPLLLLYICVALRLIVGMAIAIPFEAEVAYIALLAILPKIVVLWLSSGMMCAERQSGFLETLLTTPIPASAILGGKIRAIKRQVLPALAFALLAQWMISTQWWGANRDIPVSTTVVFAVMITILIDVQTVAWIGLWQGLAARDRRRALIRSIVWGVAMPWLPALTFFAMMAFLFDPGWLGEPIYTAAPALISANIISVGLACWAMARLHEKFRSTATQTWSLKTP